MKKALAYFSTDDGIITHVAGQVTPAVINDWFSHHKIEGGFMKFHDQETSVIMEEIARLFGNFEISVRTTEAGKKAGHGELTETTSFFRMVVAGCAKNQSAKLRIYIYR